MQPYRYLALNSEQQAVRGELQSASVAQAVAQLEAQGLSVQSICLATAESPFGSNTSTADSVVSGDGLSLEQAALESHLVAVLVRGREIVPALRAYAEELPPARRKHLSAVVEVLERGESSDAVAALAKLPQYWIPLLSAATASRDPGRVLSDFLDESQRAVDLRRQWWLTFAYPLAVAAIAAVVLTALSLLVVPLFREIFLEFELRLPWLTVFVIESAAWIASGRILLLAALVILGGWLVRQGLRQLPTSYQVWFGDRWGTPFGRANATARLAQYMADLLEAGLSVPSALRIAGFLTHSGRLRRAAWWLAAHYESPHGGNSQPLRPLTRTFLHALSGEAAPTARIRLLRELSVCHAERGRAYLSWTHGLFEPLAICVVGALVGFTVLALFLPLFSLLRGLTGQ